MKNIIAVVLMLGMIILPLASADIVLEQVHSGSEISLSKNLNVELKNATVIINVNGNHGELGGYFYVYSNEEEPTEAVVYLKAKGEDCYRGKCNDVETATSATSFNINNDNPPGTISGRSEGVSSFAEVYEIDGEKFAGVNFTLLPKQINKIKVYQEISVPFEYYLDSLSTFKKADYEKIIIRGENLSVKFNEKYPVRKVSDNEWVWEYSNINVKDDNLKDVLTIDTNNTDKNIEEPIGFWEKIWVWIKNLFS